MVSATNSWAREAPNAAAAADANGVRDTALLVWVRWRVNLMLPAYGQSTKEFYNKVCHRPATIFGMHHHFL